MRIETVEESRDTQLSLTEDQAVALTSLGAKLASKTSWWGAAYDEDADLEKRVIRVFRGTRADGQSAWTMPSE
jgi:hypothetical protein